MIKLKIKYGNSQTDLRFPCTEKEMNAALERIHAEDVTPLELYVSEVVFPEELGCLQDRFVNLDEVNYLGKRMDSFFGDEEYQFYEAMKFEGFDTLPDLINLSFNLNRYPLIQDIGDMGKIGREYCDTTFSVLRFSRFCGEANLENGGPRQRGKGVPKCKKAPGAQWLREQDTILE